MLLAVNWAAIAPLLVLAVAVVAYGWWDLSRSEVQLLPKWAWALIIIISVPMGVIAYFLVGRKPR
jgi:hypothetical protein